MPDGFFLYFQRRFPRLFVHVYRAVPAGGTHGDVSFQRYYEADGQPERPAADLAP